MPGLAGRLVTGQLKALVIAGNGPGLTQRDEDRRQVFVGLNWEGSQVLSFIFGSTKEVCLPVFKGAVTEETPSMGSTLQCA